MHLLVDVVTVEVDFELLGRYDRVLVGATASAAAREPLGRGQGATRAHGHRQEYL